MTLSRRRRDAFTLVEVLVAIFIVALAFLPLLGVLRGDATVTFKTGNVNKSAAILNRLMEDLKHIPLAMYLKECPDLAKKELIPIDSRFFADTLAKIQEYQSRHFPRQYVLRPWMQGTMNEAGQLVELYLQLEIECRDRPDPDKKTPPQRVRAATIIFNHDARF